MFCKQHKNIVAYLMTIDPPAPDEAEVRTSHILPFLLNLEHIAS